ncbi:MAG: hypothetical protein K0R12_26 [Gammaproteobacteria bacterium]|jgi:hypothetical protein|nr:hypothetical protein [Gammaproteobacteria bacterium]
MKVPAPHYSAISDSTAWKALENLIGRFALNEQEALILMGDMPRSSYYNGLKKHSGKLTRDQKERISWLLGVYKALRILFIDSAQGLSWINRNNTLPPFNGITPKQYMLEGSIVRLAEVRRFLDFWRGY